MHYRRMRVHGDPLISLRRTSRWMSPEDRFALMSGCADADSCWEWNGPVMNNGYGVIVVSGRRWTAHRFSYYLHNGTEADGMVLHSCDNKTCVNPRHLRSGSAGDNASDMKIRNRSTFGERSWSAKLTADDVREIRRMAISGMTHQRIADMYPVNREAIGKIVRRERWERV